MSPSGIIGLVVYFFVFVPALISGLNALQMAVIADPATDMLRSILAAVPNIFAAIAILAVTYFVAKPVSGIVAKIARSGFGP